MLDWNRNAPLLVEVSGRRDADVRMSHKSASGINAVFVGNERSNLLPEFMDRTFRLHSIRTEPVHQFVKQPLAPVVVRIRLGRVGVR